MSLSWCGPWRSAMSVRKPSVVFWFLVFLLCSTGSTSQSLPATDQAEKTALVALRDAISNSRSTLGTWFSGDPCNGWSGVFCTQEDYPDELKSSTSSHVTELRLLNRNLVGTLDKAVGDLKALKILDVMWNNLTGSIPDTLGNIKTLELLLLNGNKFDGPLPDSLGNLVNLDRLQIDENHFSGPVPTSFQKLSSVEHLHMNNNSLSGPIPPELGSLPRLVHLLLDNNKLTGKLPEELANISTLMILQLDNNTFDANTTIPPAYLQMPSLLKLSLRSCNLVGQIPGEISSPKLGVLDLSENRLNGTIPDFPPEAVLTAIDLSVNNLSGPIPSSIGELGNLSYILLNHNNITGSVPDSLGSVALYDDPGARFIWDFQDNGITSWPNSASLIGKANSDFLFAGNPLCDNQIAANCQPQSVNEVLQIGTAINASTNKGSACLPCEGNFQLIPDAENAIEKCRCAVPIIIWYRLKSPGFSLFDLYELSFKSYIASGLKISVDQVEIKDYTYEPGPRLSMHLLLFPSTGNYFNTTEVTRISNEFAQWTITDSNIYGPYELLKFTAGVDPSSSESSGLAAGAIAGIVLGVLLAVALFLVILYMYFMLQKQKRKPVPPLRTRYRHTGTFSKIKATGLAEFTWEEMEQFTSKFSDANVLGVGGFGKVYMGVLEDGTKVAIKRAGMAVGSDEQFETEIELLSRVHHRHLVGLKGFCIDDDSGDKFLVYEFMANGSVEDHLPPHSTSPLDFPTRVRVALGAAKGLNYLHTEANPPIYHRDIKASNILLDEKFNAKVSDFGVSKNAPELDEEGNQGGGVDTLVKGTPGYLDPEYCLTHTLTDKSDVYSFGVLLMVLLTGKQAITQGKNIVRHVTMAMANDEEMIVSLVDTYIAHQCPVDIAEAWARLAIRCTKEDPLDRPSMTEVVRELETISKDCNMFRAETPSSSNPSTFTTMTSTDGTTQSSSDTREWPDPKTSAVYESHPSAVNLMSDYDGRTSQSKP